MKNNSISTPLIAALLTGLVAHVACGADDTSGRPNGPATSTATTSGTMSSGSSATGSNVATTGTASGTSSSGSTMSTGTSSSGSSGGTNSSAATGGTSSTTSGATSTVAGSGGNTAGGNGGASGAGNGGVGTGSGGVDGGAGSGGRGSGGAPDAGRADGSGGSSIDAGRDGSRGGGGAGGTGGSSGAGGAGGKASGTGGTAGAGGTGGGALVDQLLALTKACPRVASSHTYQTDNGAGVNICSLNGAVYWTADMDIDCDGRNVNDGKCPGPDPTYLPDTAFHNTSDQPLAASLTPYVVIPQDFQIAGLAGGNVVAVIYNGKIQYAVFGDTGPTDIIGEASYACAVGLGINPNPANGGVSGGVTYIAFIGNGTRPADIENLAQTATLGQQLATRLVQNNP